MALVALLVERPCHEYELVSRYQARYAQLHAVTRDRVKQIIRACWIEGLIERVEIEAELRSRASHQYKPTGLGARTFREWLEPPDATDDGLLQRLSAARGHRAFLMTVVGGYAQRSADGIDRLPVAPIDDKVDLLVQEFARRKLEIGLRWAADARSILEDDR